MSSPPFKVKAIYEYASPHEDDLHFPNGQIITVTEEEDEDWYVGEYVDASGVKQEGIFPRNFVEKYEPTAPPRPTRVNRPKKEVEPAPAPVPEPVIEPEPESEPEVEEAQPEPAPREPSPLHPPQVISAPPPPIPEVSSPPAIPKPTPVSSKPSGPPPVSEKPSGGSFRDRIAAFNKAAPPPAPYKPGGLSSGGANSFIKKPFVAPPPSKNAYVPAPREPPPQKIYRRDEDPEIAVKESENLEQAERAGLVPSTDADAEDQPKPTSLKERIALLQKQQAEQAARHVDAAAKKDKPKRPAKKRTESHGIADGAEEDDGAALEKKDTQETVGKPSTDLLREEPSAPRRRKSSKGAPTTPGLHSRKSFGDGNEADMSGAGDTTADEPEEISTGRDSDEKPRIRAPPPPARTPAAPAREPDVGEEEGASEDDAPENEEEEEEEDDIDPEVRRREELRARMAKMSGGMGMHGMFGAMPMPTSAPPKKKKSMGVSENSMNEHGADDSPTTSTRAPPVPMIPLPGMSKVRSPEELNKQLHDVDDDENPTPVSRTRPTDEIPDSEDVVPERSAPPPVPTHDTAAPPIPSGRPGPPPIPKETRPVPPPPAQLVSPSAGSESDDELSEQAQNPTLATPTAEAPRAPPRLPQVPTSPVARRGSYFGTEEISPSSPITPGSNKDKRNSRLPPPIPGPASVTAPQGRAPPPPPPGASLSRRSTGDHHALPPPKSVPQDLSDEEEVTEYEGDYDTDIASAAPHKDALKAHARDSSLDEPTSGRAPLGSPPSGPPPLPSSSAPRGIPPPLPPQPPPNSRQSADMPRAAPPPPPPSKMPAPWEQDDDDEYDPYKYTAPSTAPRPNVPPVNAPVPVQRTNSDLYSASPPRSYASSVPQERAAPPPPPRESAPASANRAPPRQSLDVNRSAGISRRSTDLGRMSMDVGFVANDIDLGKSSFWWTQPNGIPPVFQGRKDILYELVESTSKQGAQSLVTKELFVMFQDYSQSIVTAHFDAQNPADIQLSQRHESPPSRLRQDQLENAHDQFGRRINEAVISKKETVVGDGTPHGLIKELLKPLADALLPVGTRGYGAVVYGNLANASTQQNDEIRPGDIITLRNTKFQGKHGPMHAKYSMEVGKPDHVGVVAEWDGTKKKVRAWEQGRESKKVKLESFKLDDLRSGEVKIWRVMPRSWVGWEGQN